MTIRGVRKRCSLCGRSMQRWGKTVHEKQRWRCRDCETTGTRKRVGNRDKRRLGAAGSSLSNALPDLFRFVTDPTVPKTSNHVEGGMNHPAAERTGYRSRFFKSSIRNAAEPRGIHPRENERELESGVTILNRFVHLPECYLNQYVFVVLNLETSMLSVLSEHDGVTEEILSLSFPYTL